MTSQAQRINQRVEPFLGSLRKRILCGLRHTQVVYVCSCTIPGLLRPLTVLSRDKRRQTEFAGTNLASAEGLFRCRSADHAPQNPALIQDREFQADTEACLPRCLGPNCTTRYASKAYNRPRCSRSQSHRRLLPPGRVRYRQKRRLREHREEAFSLILKNGLVRKNRQAKDSQKSKKRLTFEFLFHLRVEVIIMLP